MSRYNKNQRLKESIMESKVAQERYNGKKNMLINDLNEWMLEDNGPKRMQNPFPVYFGLYARNNYEICRKIKNIKKPVTSNIVITDKERRYLRKLFVDYCSIQYSLTPKQVNRIINSLIKKGNLDYKLMIKRLRCSI